MDLHQRELRRAAAEAFMESLDKLQETLCSTDQPPQPPSPEAPLPEQVTPEATEIEINLETLEQAVADIEQFMQDRR